MDHLDLLEIVTTLVYEIDDVMCCYRSNYVKSPLHRKEVTISYYVIIFIKTSVHFQFRGERLSRVH